MFSKKEKEVKKKDLQKSSKDKFIEFMKNLLFAAVAALLIKSFLIETSRVPTGSMEKTILVGDFLFVNKFIYGSSSPRNIPFTNIALPFFTLPALTEPEKGDIVVFEYPGNRDQLVADDISNYVKRCIAVPGDTLHIRNKVIFVNGKELPIPAKIQYKSPPEPEGMADPSIFPKGAKWNRDNYGPYVIPKKGDVIKLTPENWQWWRTIINREFGKMVVTLSNNEVQINGVPVKEYTIQKDYYFMMGDNRDNSMDSRFWGLVPRDMVVGQAFITLFSWDRDIPFSQFFRLIGSIRMDRVLKLLH